MVSLDKFGLKLPLLTRLEVRLRSSAPTRERLVSGHGGKLFSYKGEGIPQLETLGERDRLPSSARGRGILPLGEGSGIGNCKKGRE